MQKQERTRRKVVAELTRSELGELLVAQGERRVVFQRRFVEGPAWTAANLDALARAAERAQGLHDPRLLAVVDVERAAGELTVATEYVEGVTLSILMGRARTERRSVPASAVLRIGEELARAVIAAEQLYADRHAGVYLSGLSPAGVLISSGDDALIADLAGASLDSPATAPALLAYRAPEGTGPASAVYSLGMILWELLAGRDALDQNAPGTTADKVRESARAGIPRLETKEEVSPLLIETITQAVRADPRARFPSPQALSDALTAVRASRRPGELLRFMNELCSDLLERQRGAIVRGKIAPSSWRPTVHAIDVDQPSIPRAPRLIGLAAFKPPGSEDSGPPSAPSVDIVTSSGLGEPQIRNAPGADEPLVGSMPAASTLTQQGADGAPRPTASSLHVPVSFDDDDLDLRPRRSVLPTLAALLVIGGVGAAGYYAYQSYSRQQAEAPLPAPLESSELADNSGAADAATSSAAPGSVRPKASVTALRKRSDAAASDAGAAEASMGSSVEPQIENPYRDASAPPAPSAAPAPSASTPVSDVLGY